MEEPVSTTRPVSASGHCGTCGQPAPATPCTLCAPTGSFGHPDRAVRLAALHQATAAQRPQVLLAALRAGALWEADAEVLLGWLLSQGVTDTFARWLAEDAVHGDRAVAVLAEQAGEADRCLLRSPVWVARSTERSERDLPHPLVRAWAPHPARVLGLGFRLGGCAHEAGGDTLFGHYLHSFPDLYGLLAAPVLWAGRRWPTGSTWTPSADHLARSRGWRRWPLAWIEGGCVLVCTVCGEGLPAEGPCTFCGTSPEDEGPTELPLADLLAVRPPCPICGFDLTGTAHPVRCAGCGGTLAWSSDRPTSA